jgi:acyl-coenzyme A thioesterase PaaI-like protein
MAEAAVFDLASRLDALLNAGWEVRKGAPWFDLVGPVLMRRGAEGCWRFAILADERHLNPDRTVNGGLLLCFADQTMALALKEQTKDAPQATVHIEASFLSAVYPGDLIEAECEVVHRTGSMAFARGVFRVGDRKVGTATGLWRIFGH